MTKSEKAELIFNNIFYLTQYIENIVLLCNYHEIIKGIFYIIFSF